MIVFCGLSNMFISIIIFLPAQYIIDKYSLKKATVIGEVFILMGAIIRLFLPFGFTFYFIGTMVCSVGTVWFTFTINKFVATWFDYKEIAFATSIVWVTSLISGPISTVITGFVLQDDATKAEYEVFFRYHSVIMITVQLLLILFLKGKPEHPVNYFAVAQRESLKEACKVLKKRKNYMLIVAAYSFTFGYMLSVLSSLSWMLKIYGMGAERAVIYIIVMNTSGLLGTIVFGYFVRRLQNYKIVLIICAATNLAFMVGVFVTLDRGLFLVSVILTGIATFCAMPIVTLSQDFATELAYPVT